MEPIELSDIGIEPIKINLGGNDSSSTNFGGGIELLMNDKNKSPSSNTKIDIGELDKLESDLNDLSSINLNKSNFDPTPMETVKLDSLPSNNNIHVSFETDSKVGASTIESVGKTNTWDGFMKFNEVPVTENKPMPSLSDRDMKRKKRQMIKSLNDWQEKGWIKDTSRYNMDSNYDDIEDEYESALDDKRKRDSVKVQQNWMITMINTIEYGNSMFDPFGVSLDGWGEAVSEDIDSYDEILGELYEKYKGGKMSPELSLLLRLGFSASVVHFSNKALSSATPGFNDVIKQSPELMRMFTNATVDSMKQASPGMAFAEELLNTKPNTTTGPPPAPVETRGQAPPSRPGAMQFTQNPPSNRPDINAGRGADAMSSMFREGGVELNSSFGANDVQHMAANPPSMTRPEMSGPRNTDIDNILSGLKTKPVEPQAVQNVDIHTTNNDEDSMISVSSLKELDGNGVPKKSKRRNRSDKKVVSLDI